MRPRVDLGIEFGNEPSSEDFQELPTRTGRYPGVLRPFEIARRRAIAQITCAVQGAPNAFDHVRPIVRGAVIERPGVRRPNREQAQGATHHYSYRDHRLKTPGRNKLTATVQSAGTSEPYCSTPYAVL